MQIAQELEQVQEVKITVLPYMGPTTFKPRPYTPGAYGNEISDMFRFRRIGDGAYATIPCALHD